MSIDNVITKIENAIKEYVDKNERQPEKIIMHIRLAFRFRCYCIENKVNDFIIKDKINHFKGIPIDIIFDQNSKFFSIL